MYLSQRNVFNESSYWTVIQIKKPLYYAHKKSSILLYLCRVTVTFTILCKTLIKSECKMRSDRFLLSLFFPFLFLTRVALIDREY